MIKKILGWAGFSSWKLWVIGLAGVILLGLAVQNAFLGHELKAADARVDVVEGKLNDALDTNQELLNTVSRIRLGAEIDATVVAQNQEELNRIRRETDERQKDVERQQSGPASDAIVCAITRVCD